MSCGSYCQGVGQKEFSFCLVLYFINDPSARQMILIRLFSSVRTTLYVDRAQTFYSSPLPPPPPHTHTHTFIRLVFIVKRRKATLRRPSATPTAHPGSIIPLGTATGYIRGYQNGDDVNMVINAIGTGPLACGIAPEGPNTGGNYLVSTSC
jgi:hypothetical protein